jgi:DNA-binding phage protein
MVYTLYVGESKKGSLQMTANPPTSTHADETAELANARRVQSYAIGTAMQTAGLSNRFIVAAVTVAGEYEGVFELLQLWSTESDPVERDALVADLQDLIDDVSQPETIEGASVRFDDLVRIAADVRQFKDSLRTLVDERGGISKLAALTGIPQPSLSRFFSTPAMPRRTTLRKIARALGLSQIQIATAWAV